MPPRIGNRATESDYKNYSPKEVLFGPETERRKKRTDAQVASESRTRVGKGNIGVPAGDKTVVPKTVPESVPATPSNPNATKGAGQRIEDREKYATKG
jgi:hypothetical protein